MFSVVTKTPSFLNHSDGLILSYQLITNSYPIALAVKRRLRKVWDKHIISKLYSVIYPCNNEILMNSWAAVPFKFQWQKIKDDCMEPGLIFISPKQYNKILIYIKKVHLPRNGMSKNK